MQFVKTPAAPSDELFLFDLYASTRQEELTLVPWDEEQKKAFLFQQFQAQHNYYQSKYPTAEFSIISNNDERIGRLYVLELETEIRILDITITPEQRNRGFGKLLITEIIEKAKNDNKSVSIFIEKMNRSASLFARFGFKPSDVDDVYQLWSLDFENESSSSFKQAVN